MSYWVHQGINEFSSSPNAQHYSTKLDFALVQLVKEGKSSFACLQPWPSLGDPNLATLLSADWENEKQTSALIQAMRETLEAGLNSFSLKSGEFRLPVCAKLKLFGNPKIDANKVNQWVHKNPGLKLRLDANLSFDSLLDYQNFITSLSDQSRSQIVFVEDPFQYEAQQWSQAESLGIALANDRALDWGEINDPVGFSVLIWKPSVKPWSKLLPYKHISISVTHNMDHPVGVLTSIFWALFAQQQGFHLRECGLLDQASEPFIFELFDFDQQHLVSKKDFSVRWPKSLLQQLEEMSWTPRV